MGNNVSDTGKATAGFYAANVPTGTSALGILLLTSTVTDTILEAYTTIAAMLAAQTEATASGYARIILSSGITVSTAAHVITWTLSSNPAWAAIASGNTLTRLVIYYRPVTASADSACIPLATYDFAGITDGSSITAQINASGLATWT